MNERYFMIASRYIDGQPISLPKGEYLQFARFARQFLSEELATGLLHALLANALEDLSNIGESENRVAV